MKKAMLMLLCLVLLLSLATPALAAAGSASLSASATTLSRGSTFTITVYLSNSESISMCTTKLTYDTAALQMTGGSCLVANTATSSVVPMYNVGTLMLNSETVLSGNIFVFEMKVLENAPYGSYTISSKTSIGETVYITSGSVTVSVACSHDYSGWTSANENEHKKTCSKCYDEQTEGHKWDGGQETKPATCKDEGEKTYTCTVCKTTKTEKTPVSTKHSFGNLVSVNDNEHKDVCSVCKKEITEPHNWNGGTVTKRATCKEAGEKTYTCTGCKKTRTEEIPILTTHSFGKWEKVSDTEHKHICSVCKKEETETHSYKTTWSKDKTGHWHECAGCKDKKDFAQHTPGAAATEKTAQTCTICKYVIKPALGHTHKYATEYTTDEKGHWYTCSGCEEQGQYAEHDFENVCDGDCSVCGYTRETAHDIPDSWKTDSQKHWHECTGCGLKEDEDVHIPGPAATEDAAQTCTVCGYELAPALEKENAPAEDPLNASGESGSFPWWIILAVVALIAVGGIFLILLLLKRRS